MSLELVAGGVAIVLGLVGGGFGWSQIRKHGGVKATLKHVKEKLDAERKSREESRRPDLTPDQHDDFIDRL